MPNTKNSPEYLILELLNTNFENYDFWDADLNKRLVEQDRKLTNHQVDLELKRLKEIGYVSNKNSGDHPKGLTITPQGQIRYNQMVQHSETLRQLSSINQQTGDTSHTVEKIAKYGLIVSVIALGFSFLQVLYAYLQYSAAIEQLLLQSQKVQ